MKNKTPNFWKKIFKIPSSKIKIGKKTETNRYYYVVVFNGENNSRGEMGLIVDSFKCSPDELENKIENYPGTELVFYCYLIKEFDRGNNKKHKPKIRKK